MECNKMNYSRYRKTYVSIIANHACPRCQAAGRDRTGDHLLEYDDGAGYCARCNWYVQDVAEALGENSPGPTLSLSQPPTGSPAGVGKLDEIASLAASDVPSQGLKKTFVSLYGGKLAFGNGKNQAPTAVYWPRYRGGDLVAYKEKGLGDKTFRSIGDGKDTDLFGMELAGGFRLCIVTEGECDAVAAKQMLAANGKDYRVVSLPNGAGSTLTKASYEWLAGFETVILATDMDQAGEKAAESLSELLGPAKCKRAKLPAKDSVDCLRDGLTSAWFEAIRNARPVQVDGIVAGADTLDAVLTDYFSDKSHGLSYPFESLNRTIFGMRKGELDTFAAGSGMGKTAFIRETVHHLACHHNVRVGLLSLEEPMEDTVLGQCSLVANKTLHHPDIRKSVTKDELTEYWHEAMGNGNVTIYDHFGSMNEGSLMSKMRYLASGCGCEYLILDHLGLLTSGTATQGDERKVIDEIMTSLKKLTQELGVWVGLVSHLRKAGGDNSFENGAIPTGDDLRGSASVKQLSNQIVGFSRDQQHPDVIQRSINRLHILKSRFSGNTGPSGGLYYDRVTGRTVDATAEQLTGDEAPEMRL